MNNPETVSGMTRSVMILRSCEFGTVRVGTGVKRFRYEVHKSGELYLVKFVESYQPDQDHPPHDVRVITDVEAIKISEAVEIIENNIGEYCDAVYRAGIIDSLKQLKSIKQGENND